MSGITAASQPKTIESSATQTDQDCGDESSLKEAATRGKKVPDGDTITAGWKETVSDRGDIEDLVRKVVKDLLPELSHTASNERDVNGNAKVFSIR